MSEHYPSNEAGEIARRFHEERMQRATSRGQTVKPWRKLESAETAELITVFQELIDNRVIAAGTAVRYPSGGRY